MLPGNGNAFYCLIGLGLLCIMWKLMMNDNFTAWAKDRCFDACLLIVIGAALGVGYEWLTKP